MLLISLTYAVDIAKLPGQTEIKKPSTVIEYELTQVPSKHKQKRPMSAMEVYSNYILSDKYGAMIATLPNGQKLG